MPIRAAASAQVGAASDDAEEVIETGYVGLTSTDLELVTDGTKRQWVGIRFTGLDIPPAVLILSAVVEFEVDEAWSVPTSVTFAGQASDNAPTFTDADFDLSRRPRTAAQVAWNDIPPWTEIHTRQQSPDLAPVIQEIVSRPGWAAGNSIVLLISGTGRRTAEAYDGEALHAPRLTVDYLIGVTPTPNLTPPIPTGTPTPTAAPSLTPTPAPPFTPVAAEAIRFAVIGDYGSNNQAERDVAALVKSWNPDFIITTGDNNYPSGAAETIDQNIGQYYHDYIYPYLGAYGPGASSQRFFPTLGNHDWIAPGAQPYLDYFSLPGIERYYDFVWGPVHFFALDSDGKEPDGNASDSSQAAWLQAGLAASTSPWQLVYLHHAPYSSGANHGPNLTSQWPYQAWGADAVLAGHEHTYERILQNGLAYFVNGLGGASIYAFATPVAGSQARFNEDYGAMLVTASASRMEFQFITRGGEIIDSHVIKAGTAPATNTPTP